MMAITRLGVPHVLHRVANGFFRYRLPLSDVPDPRWAAAFVRHLERQDGLAAAQVTVAADAIIFDARAHEIPARTSDLDSCLHAANSRS